MLYADFFIEEFQSRQNIIHTYIHMYKFFLSLHFFLITLIL